MPVDSIITTIMTSVMVRIITGSKIGRPKRKGVISSNQSARSTWSKCMSPMEAASTAPTMIPSSTEILARKPRANFITRMIVVSTTAEIAMLSGVA